VVIPGSVAAERLPQLAAVHDAAMDSGNGADVKVADSTTRMYGRRKAAKHGNKPSPFDRFRDGSVI
jgi:hypothetical protein